MVSNPPLSGSRHGQQKRQTLPLSGNRTVSPLNRNGIVPTTCLVRRPPRFLFKQFCLLVRDLVPHDIAGCPCKPVCQCVVGNRVVPFLEFSVVEVPARRVEPAGVFGRFRKGPREIAVPILSVALALHLLGALPGGFRLTTVRDIVADLGEPSDRPCLEHNGEAEVLSCAG
jgi:hypothetical protein